MRAKPSQLRSNGSRRDEMSRMIGDSAPKCPCFNAGDIDDVVSHLIEKKAKANIETLSCEKDGDEELYGLNYKYDTISPEDNLSFSVSDVDANGKGFCVNDASTNSVTIEEKRQCLKLLLFDLYLCRFRYSADHFKRKHIVWVINFRSKVKEMILK